MSFEKRWDCPRCGAAPQVRSGVLLFAPDAALSHEGFDPEYFQRLASYDDWYFWFVARRELLLWIATITRPEVRAYLEVGCGAGGVLAAFANAHPEWNVAGAEVLVEGVRLAQAKVPRAFVFQADGGSLPFDQSIDMIGAFDVIEHIDNDRQTLHELQQALRPGGLLLLTVPQHQALWSSADEFAHHKRRYTRRDLIEKLRGSGFEIVLVTSFATFLLPLMAISRRWKTHDPWREFEISRLLNSLLLMLFRAELAMIRRGVPMPFGGSLAVLARKRGGSTP
jgi:SAM-dependent methyltransferase